MKLASHIEEEEKEDEESDGADDDRSGEYIPADRVMDSAAITARPISARIAAKISRDQDALKLSLFAFLVFLFL
jgi:hypothetical protein